MIPLKILAALILSMIIPTIVGMENEMSNSPYKVKGLNPLLAGMVLGFIGQILLAFVVGFIALCIKVLTL